MEAFDAGKLRHAALVAVMRQIVEIADALARENRLWTAQRPASEIAA